MITIPTTQVKTEIPPATGRTRHVLTPLPEPGHFLFVIDNSAAEKFVCPTLAANYLVEGREPHPTNAALIFGGALHVGIEELLHGPQKHWVDQEPVTVGYLEGSSSPVQLIANHLPETQAELLTRAQARITKFFTDHPAPLDEYRTLSNALEVLRFYQQRMTFPDYHMEILSDAKGPLIERAFELPLGVLEVKSNIDIKGEQTWVDFVHVAWAGRIDVIAKCHGTARIVDHKTTSIGGDSFIADFHLSSQTRGYLWAAQQLWPELNVTGFCLDAIKLKRPTGSAGLMERGPRGGDPALEFFRSYFDYSAPSVASWATNALTRVEDFIHSFARNYFPQEVTYCFNRKYGKCPYHDVCLIAQDSPEAANKLLHSHAFRQVTWNPTADR